MTTMTFPTRVTYCGIDLGMVESEEHGKQVILRHLDACLTEGICPVHRTSLAVAPHVGFCPSCSKVWQRDGISVEWTATDNRGQPL